jgi:hypothetical protein
MHHISSKLKKNIIKVFILLMCIILVEISFVHVVIGLQILCVKSCNCILVVHLTNK